MLFLGMIKSAYYPEHTINKQFFLLTWVTWVTWLLIFIGPGGSALKMLLASVASAGNVASV
jgi:hypothetical protein